MEKSKYTLKVTPAAYTDLDKIYSYIANELYNKAAAENLMDKIEASFIQLKEFLFSCNFRFSEK